MNKQGIYRILNTKTGKSYIGQTNNLGIRFSKHKYTLKKGIHYNSHLTASYNIHGKESFIYEILYTITDITDQNEILKILNEKEKEFIIKYDSLINGYNNTSGGDNFIVSEETKRKLSVSHQGQKVSEYQKQRTKEIKKLILEK